MANVTSSNGIEKYPKLRFPEFTEPWKKIKIGDIYAERSERGSETSELLSVTMNDGVKRRSELEGKDNSSEDKGNYKVVCTGDMVYNSMRMWQGANGISPYNGIVSPAYTVLTAKCDISNGFFAALFKTHKLISEFCKHSQGMTSDTWNLKYPQIESIKTYIPSVAEQQKIAALIEKVDKRIAIQKELIDSLKKYKRGLHFFAFEKNRNESWGKKTLYEIATFCGGGTPSKDKKDYWSGKIGWISSSDLDEEWIDTISVSRYITKSAIDNSATKLCPKGTISIVSRVGVGKVAVMPENLCTSQDFINITSIDGDTKFFAYQIAYKMKIQATKTQGTSIKGVTSETLKAMVLDIPPLKEQIHISKMLLSVDKRLKVELNTLNKMQTIKNGMLQQLFI